MEKKTVKTLIKRNHNLFGKEYVLGRISGIGYCTSESGKGYARIEICEGLLYINDFTPDSYDKFMNIVEELYPGLCEFNYQERESY